MEHGCRGKFICWFHQICRKLAARTFNSPLRRLGSGLTISSTTRVEPPQQPMSRATAYLTQRQLFLGIDIIAISHNQGPSINTRKSVESRMSVRCLQVPLHRLIPSLRLRLLRLGFRMRFRPRQGATIAQMCKELLLVMRKCLKVAAAADMLGGNEYVGHCCLASEVGEGLLDHGAILCACQQRDMIITE